MMLNGKRIFLSVMIALLLVLVSTNFKLEIMDGPKLLWHSKKSSADSTKRSHTNESNIDVRGIYLNRTALKEENFEEYIDLVKSTELNAVVMDVKDDFGKLTYNSNSKTATSIGADQEPTVHDMQNLVNRLKKEGIYTIARIVVFKDPLLAEQKSDFAIKKKDGRIWQDDQNVKWIDPYKREVWEYMFDISEEVAAFGFDEIQYDYIRFPDNAAQVDQEVAFDNPSGQSTSDNVIDFIQHDIKRLDAYSVQLSADVFGLVTTARDDMGIGQKWEEIASYVDYISPMAYPSHYAEGSYGIDHPDDHPYDVMKHAIQDARERNETLKKKGKNPAIIRPWIQDFDFGRNYTAKDVRKQIKALNELGITQYLAWNAASEYNDAAYRR